MADYVCSNPNCGSYAQPHPNCRCSAPEGHYALGGAVHYCTTGLGHHKSCEHYADGGHVEINREFATNPDLAVDHSVAQHGLLHTLSRTGYTKSKEPGREHAEFLDAHHTGRKSLRTHVGSFADKHPNEHEHHRKSTEALQAKLDELAADPEKALNIGGNLGDTLPMHAAALAAKAGTAITYLQSIRPQPISGGSLDAKLPVSHMAQREYERQVAIAENPRLVLQHLKNGTLVPQDLATLGTLYPKLRQSLQDEAFQTLADAESSGKHLTHKQKRHLGALLGEPVTFQQTPQACQAIMQANAPEQPPAPAGKQPKKASATELKQIDKVNEMSQTPLQRLQARQK